MKKQAAGLIRSAFSLISLCVVSVVCAAIASAQSNRGNPNNPPPSGRTGGVVSHTIRGKIVLPSGHLPEHRIRVVLELNSGGIAGETFSDSVGNFEFRSLPNSSYRVTVHSDNRTYETSQETVELHGNFPRTFMVQVYLKEKSDARIFKPKEKIISVADFQEVPKAARKAYEKGLKLAQDNRMEDAAARFQEAITAFPDYLHAINKLGEQYMAMNKLSEAQSMYERAIAVNGKFALPHINLGLLYVNRKDYAQAITSLETANGLDDTYPMSHFYLGIALLSNDPPDLERAEKELERSIAMGGRNFVAARKYLYNLCVRRTDMVKAVEHLEAYLKDAPNAPDADDVRKRLASVKKLIEEKKEAGKQ
jgi:tetratricopeptide (TPR) repeat protein